MLRIMLRTRAVRKNTVIWGNSMRMHKKKNLETRLDNCKEILITPVCDEPNYVKAASGEDYLDLTALFGTDKNIELEIGCGKGGFACTLAAMHPETPLLAVEKCGNVIITGCERAIKENIQNLRFMRCGAEVLTRYLPPHSISRIYLNFSCPYPKKSYENHRLTGVRFLETYKKLLAPGGEIHQKTDNMHFFEYSIEQFTAAGYKLKNISLDLHNSNFEGNIVTEYEQHFSDLGKPIYRLEAYL